jgi:hypothetical protein
MCDACQASSSLLAAQQNSIQLQIQFALAAKQQSAVKSQGAAVVELLQAAAQVGKSANSGALLDLQG